MKVPDGTDYLEYMLMGSDPVDRVRLGSLHHMALLVPDIQAALETVRARAPAASTPRPCARPRSAATGAGSSTCSIRTGAARS